MATVTVLSPVGEPRAASLVVPAVPGDLRGLTVGFIDNRKTNFDQLVTLLGEMLVGQHGVARVIHRTKAHAAVPASPALLAEMARSCDLVITGSAD